MSDAESAPGAEPTPDPTSAPGTDSIKADIEATRAQLAQTADALAAKLDVQAQADNLVQDVAAKAADAYESAKASAPEPVQKVIGKAEVAAQPVVAKAAQDKLRTALIVGGVLAALLVAKRIRTRRKGA